MDRNDSKKQSKKRIETALLMAIISLCVGVLLGTQKDLFYCDEAWTYESANSSWKEPIFNRTCQWISGDDVSNYLAATDESLRFSEILENLWTDHVPLYFWLFRLVSMVFFYGSSSVWVGLSINIFFYVVLTIWLYYMVDHLLQDRILSGVSVGIFLWTVPMTLEHVTLIRMYLILFLECAMTIGLFIRLITANPITRNSDYSVCIEKNSKNQWIQFSLCLFMVVTAGLLTHYYFWPFVLIAGAFSALILLAKKNYRSFIMLVATGTVSAACATVLDDAKWIKNLFRDNGQLAVNQLVSNTKTFRFDIFGVLEKIGDSVCLFGLNWYIKLIIVFGVIIAAVLLRKQKKDGKYMLASSLVIFTVFACSLVISAANIKDFVRYYWPLLMLWNLLFYVSAGVILKELKDRYKQKNKGSRNVSNAIPMIMAFLILAAITGFNIKTVDFGNGLYYLGKAESDDVFLKGNANIPWIVYSDTYDYDEESLLFDLKIANRLCLIRTSNQTTAEKFSLPEEEVLLLFCRSESVEEAMEFINNAGNDNYTYDLVEDYHNTVFSFYMLNRSRFP